MCRTSLTGLARRVHLDRLAVPLVGEGSRARVEQPEAATEAPPVLDQPPILVQKRARIGALVLDVPSGRVGRRQPPRAGREAACWAGIALHRMPQPVTVGAVVRRP